MNMRNALLDAKIEEIFNMRDELFRKAGGEPRGNYQEDMQRNNKLALKYALSIYSEMRNRGISMQDIINHPQFDSGKLKFAKIILSDFINKVTEDIFNRRDELYQNAGGNPRGNYQDELAKNKDLRMNYALSIYQEARKNNISLQEILNSEKFSSGKLLVAKKSLEDHLNMTAKTIFTMREKLWDESVKIAGNSKEKSALIFMLLIKQFADKSGLSMRDLSQHEVFQSGRLMRAMQLYTAVRAHTSGEKAEQQDAPRPAKKQEGEKLAMQHANSPGLFTQAGIAERFDKDVILKQAKQAALHHHPDKQQPDRRDDVLLAANDILNLNKQGQLSGYIEALHKERAGHELK